MILTELDSRHNFDPELEPPDKIEKMTKTEALVRWAVDRDVWDLLDSSVRDSFTGCLGYYGSKFDSNLRKINSHTDEALLILHESWDTQFQANQNPAQIEAMMPTISFTNDEGATSIQWYLNQIGQIPLLTPEEEIDLNKWIWAARTQGKKDEFAEGKFTIANLRLVVSIAKKHQNMGLTLPDLIQEGNIALMDKAVPMFDHRKGRGFVTYAAFWIKQAITRATDNQGPIINAPIYFWQRKRSMDRIKQTLIQICGQEPTDEELAEAMGLSIEKIEDLQSTSKETISLQKPVKSGEDTELGDLIPDLSGLTVEESVIKTCLADQVNKHLAILNKRERTVLRLHFGLSGERSHTLAEIGKESNVTRERIRQIEAQAFRKLKRFPPISRKLRGLLDD